MIEFFQIGSRELPSVFHETGSSLAGGASLFRMTDGHGAGCSVSSISRSSHCL